MNLRKSSWKKVGILVCIAVVILTFTACDNDSGNEVAIEEVEEIPVVEVPYGTSGEEVISDELPETADVELSSDETVTVNIGWEVPDDYSGTPENTPKTYTFEGSFSVGGKDLAGNLEVEVTVLEEDPFTEKTVNISYNDLNLNDVDTVTSSDEEIVAVEDDPDNDQIVITLASEGSDITITIKNTEGNEATVVIDIAEDGTITETVEPFGTEITDMAAIEGVPEDGETLTAGELTPADATADYKWQYKDGSDWEDLTDGESYTIDVEEDAVSEGDDVKVVAAGTGDYYGEVESAAVTIVAPETGSIKGNVKGSDTNDNIEGVTVESEVEGKIYSDTTNDNGDYTLENLPLGEHEVKAEHNNYDSATETAPGIEEDGDTVTQDFSLNDSKIDAVGIASPKKSDPAVEQSGEVVTVDYEADDINFDEATLVVEDNGEEIYNDTVAQGDKTQDIDLSGAAEGEYDVTLTVTDTAGNEKSVEEAGAIVVDDSIDTPVDITEISPKTLNSNETVTISYDADDENMSEVLLTVTNPSGDAVVDERSVDAGTGETEEVDLSELSNIEEGHYDVKVEIVDKAGNSDSDTESDAFEVDVIVDNMVTVPAGTAADGSTSIGYDIEMGKYEVTQAEYESVMDKNPSHFSGDNKPVESISWYDAVEYCNKLSEQEGLTPAYDTSGDKVTWDLEDDPQDLEGYRLPTETEWEYAARGGDDGENTTYAGSDDIENVAWYDGNSGYKTHPVGEKQANELGIYDMSGNVWEWTNARSGSNRVARGGSWYSIDTGCVVIYRLGADPSGSYGLGFRLTKTK